MADATSAAISPTVSNNAGYTPATSNGQNAYDIQRQQIQSQSEQQRLAAQNALKRRLAAQGISDSGVNVASQNTIDTTAAQNEGAALSNVDTQQLQAAQAAQTAAQQFGYQTALQGQSIAGTQSAIMTQGGVQSGLLGTQYGLMGGLAAQQAGYTSAQIAENAGYQQQLQSMVIAGQMTLASANAMYAQALQSGAIAGQMGEIAAQGGVQSGLLGQQISGQLQAISAQAGNTLAQMAAQAGYTSAQISQASQDQLAQMAAAAGYTSAQIAQGIAGQLQTIGAQGAVQLSLASSTAGYTSAQIAQQIAGQLSLTSASVAGQVTEIMAQMSGQSGLIGLQNTLQQQDQSQAALAASLFQAGSVPGSQPTAEQQALMQSNPIYQAAFEAGQNGVPYNEYQTQLANTQAFQKAAVTSLSPGWPDLQALLTSIYSTSGTAGAAQTGYGQSWQNVGGQLMYQSNGQWYNQSNQPVSGPS